MNQNDTLIKCFSRGIMICLVLDHEQKDRIYRHINDYVWNQYVAVDASDPYSHPTR